MFPDFLVGWVTDHEFPFQIVMSLKVATKDGSRTVGAAFADVTSRSLGVAEFADNDLFSNTEVRPPKARRMQSRPS